MFRRNLGLFLTLTIAASLNACTVGSPDPTVEPTEVGQVIIHWDEAQDHPLDWEAVSWGATLLHDDAAWRTWVDELPEEMREFRGDALAEVTLDEHVIVVAVWDRCQETSAVLHDGDGNLRFVVVPPDETVLCYWSPRQVEVWQIPLDVLGVDRSDVSLPA